MGWREQYEGVINSFRWRALRRRLIAERGCKCERCKTERQYHELELHHLTYVRLGNEKDEDLLILCPSCHADADRERNAATAVRHWNARLDGWASKKYGDDWAECGDAESICEEFEQWLQDRDE